MADPFVGKLTYFRVYSGKLESGARVLNVSTGQDRADRAHPDDARQRPRGGPARSTPATSPPPSGIKQVTTGDTLAAPDAPIKLEQIVFPEPVIKVAVEPKTKIDQQKMSVALGRLAEEDPTFRVQTNDETGQTEISGMGELHLEVLVDRMRREYNVEANVGRPQVSYRETVRGEARHVEGQLHPPDRRLGPVRRRLHRPRAGARRGLRLRQQDQGRLGSERVHPRGREGLRGGARERRARPATRWSTSASRSTDGKYHDTDSSEIAFKVAGSLAFKEAARRAKPVLLEPIFAVEVVTPEEFLGDVIGDLSRRRGRIEGQERRGNALTVTARVPLSEMFGYATDLRSNTQGRATYTMQFEAYEEVPPNIAERVIESRGGESSRRPEPRRAAQGAAF